MTHDVQTQSSGNGGLVVVLLIGAAIFIVPMLHMPGKQAQPALQIPGVQEAHVAEKLSDCQKLSNRFARQGRQVQFVRAIANPNNSFFYPWLCIFMGPDAASWLYSRPLRPGEKGRVPSQTEGWWFSGDGRTVRPPEPRFRMEPPPSVPPPSHPPVSVP